MGDKRWSIYRFNMRTQRIEQFREIREAGVNRQRVVNRYRLVACHAKYKKCHGDTVIKMGFDRSTATGRFLTGDMKRVALGARRNAAACQRVDDGA